MHLIGRESLTAPQYLLAALAAGLGIATMHYTGMLAMQSVAIQLYDPLLVVVSVVVASLASLGALLLAFRLRGRTGLRTLWLRLLGSLVLGLPRSPCTSPAWPPSPSPCPSASNPTAWRK